MKYAFATTMGALSLATGWAGSTLIEIARRYPMAPGAWLAWFIGTCLALCMFLFGAMMVNDLAERQFLREKAERKAAWQRRLNG